jgi:short-subunit dehydrogenase
VQEKKAIVLGASSGIGRALAKVLSENGYEVGLAAPEYAQLLEVQRQVTGKTYLKTLDLSDISASVAQARELIEEMGDVGLFVVSSGVSIANPTLAWELEQATLKVNVAGFVAMLNVAAEHFVRRGSGHIVGITSIAGLCGSAVYPAYNASKACGSTYLSGLRQRFAPAIAVTDIRPGYVKTPMVRDSKGIFWMTTPEVAAQQIFEAIQKKKGVAYITKRWALVAAALQWLPGSLYEWAYRRFRTG